MAGVIPRNPRFRDFPGPKFPAPASRDQGLLTGLNHRFHGKFLLTHLVPPSNSH